MIIVRGSKPRDWAPPVLALAAIIPALHLLGSGPLTAPPVLDSDAFRQWASDTDAVVASFSILRLGALVLAYHLAATLMLAGSGRVLRRRSLVDLARRLAPSAYRGMIERVAGIGLSTTILLGAPVPVSADAPSTTETVVEQTVEHPPGTATMRLDPAIGRAELRLLDPPTTERDETPRARPAEPIETDRTERTERGGGSTTSTSAPPPSIDVTPTTDSIPTTGSVPDRTTVPTTPAREAPAAEVDESVPSSVPKRGSEETPTTAGAPVRSADDHVIEPGDHLWSLAEARLADHLGRAVTDQEIAPYWRRVVRANPQLVDPDLVFPGDVVRLPDPV